MIKLQNELHNSLSQGDNHWSHLQLQAPIMTEPINRHNVACQHHPHPTIAEAEAVRWSLASRITIESPFFNKGFLLIHRLATLQQEGWKIAAFGLASRPISRPVKEGPFTTTLSPCSPRILRSHLAYPTLVDPLSANLLSITTWIGAALLSQEELPTTREQSMREAYLISTGTPLADSSPHSLLAGGPCANTGIRTPGNGPSSFFMTEATPAEGWWGVKVRLVIMADDPRLLTTLHNALNKVAGKQPNGKVVTTLAFTRHQRCDNCHQHAPPKHRLW